MTRSIRRRLLATGSRPRREQPSSDSLAAAASKIKVAAIYTVPVEQRWVSRIHKALEAAKARNEIDYVFSETSPTPTTSG